MKIHALLLGIMVSLAVTAANAEVDGASGDYDYKRYSAAGCGATAYSKAQVTKAGSIFNTATGANTITCPVVLDRYNSNSDYYYLGVLRASGAATMTCYLSTQSGSSVTITNQTVGTTGTDTTVSFLGSGYPNSAAVGCVLPAKVAGGTSGIKYYEVYEY